MTGQRVLLYFVIRRHRFRSHLGQKTPQYYALALDSSAQ